MIVRPLTRDQANAFVRAVHRHNGSVAGWKFGVGIYVAGQLVGVGIAGRPTSWVLDQRGCGHFVEITRVAADGVTNGRSTLYGALTRAAAALGYCRAYTYTLVDLDERNFHLALKASGWSVDATLPARNGWDTPSRRRDNSATPDDARLRWIKYLDDCPNHSGDP